MIFRLLMICGVVAFVAIFGVLTNLAYPEFAQKQMDRVSSSGKLIANVIVEKQNNIVQHSSKTLSSINKSVASVGNSIEQSASQFGDAISEKVTVIAQAPSNLMSSIGHGVDHTMTVAKDIYNDTENQVVAFFDFDIPQLNGEVKWPRFANNNLYQNDSSDQPNVADLLAGIEPAAGGLDTDDDSPPSSFGYEFEIEDEELISEAVLVPKSKTVISSSRDGKIKKVHFKNGDHFEKGDTILEYHCDDIRAELEAARVERKFARQKQLTTSRLFNMDLSSKLEVEQSHVEKHQAQAKKKVVETRINDCIIRADYDGRVVKRMANDNEYTRTDRVLMEVAATGTLDIEFLLPSKSLRWINIDAPITITVNETDREYTGVVKQIYGEVDPVSQSIQIRAGLDEYQEPLLPGMSGKVSIDIRDIRQAGITGFLETKIQ